MNEMNPYKLKISQLRALVAVADYSNFSEAALQMELSQSAVSHAIATLEEELGVQLLSRGRHGAYVKNPSLNEVGRGLERTISKGNYCLPHEIQLGTNFRSFS